MSTRSSNSPEASGVPMPPQIEFAIRRVVLHYWAKEQQDYARLPERHRIGHIFQTLRLLDDWLFEQLHV